MKLKFGAIITEGVGKLGGHDFMNSRYGPNLRTRSLRTNKVSQPESFRKAILRKVATGWRELTQVQRDAWDNWANTMDWPNSFYGTIKLSGEQLFCKVNALYYYWPGIAWSSPPAFSNTVQSQLTSVVVYGSGGPLILYWADWVPVNSYIHVWATRPLSQGVTTHPKLYKYIGRVQTLDSVPVDFYDRYISVFGSVGEPGSRILFKSIVFNVVSGYQLMPTYPVTQLPVLWVGDNTNNRVLGYYKIPSNNFANADIVLCQPDFVSNAPATSVTISALNTVLPSRMVFAGGQTFRNDRDLNRVCIYNNVPHEYSAVPDICVGQPSFTTWLPGVPSPPSASNFYSARDLCVSGTKLIIADSLQHRILIWNTIPIVNNAPADVVIGQADFTSVLPNRGSSPSASSLYEPTSVLVANGKLIISDSENHRLLIYNSIPTLIDQAADVVIGQPDFISNSANRGGSCAINSLRTPFNCSFNANRIYVGDMRNHRILVFDGIPTVNDPNAVMVIGQPDMSSCLANQGLPAGNFNLRSPRAPEFINGKMLILDRANDRILVYNSIPLTYGGHADAVIGQPNFSGSSDNAGMSTNRRGLNAPQLLSIPIYF